MTIDVDSRPATRPYRVFRVFVGATHRLSPTFQRVTFTGPELDRFADNGFDQRVVLALPLPKIGFAHLPSWENWHSTWRSLPTEHRNPLRTYTVRSVRRHIDEIDVDVVLHPDGEASRWAEAAKPGHAAALLGPNDAFVGEHGGVEFRPHENNGRVLLAGDETAVPAIASILERLPQTATGEALLEVPCADDSLTLRTPAGVQISWLARCGRDPGSELVPALREAADRLLADHPAGDSAGEMAGAGTPYAWIAGEASMVREVRHHLINDRALDRRCVSCRGYWRRNR